MGYYMRYLFEGKPDIRLEYIEAALKKVDEDYSFKEWNNDNKSAEIWYQGDIYGEIDLELLEGEELDDEIQEMIEEVELIKGIFVRKAKKRVLEFLKQVKARIIIRVLGGDSESEDILRIIDPIWNWLLANYAGLIQADCEGFYEGRKPILKLK